MSKSSATELMEPHQQNGDAFYRKQLGGWKVFWKFKPCFSRSAQHCEARDAAIATALSQPCAAS